MQRTPETEDERRFCDAWCAARDRREWRVAMWPALAYHALAPVFEVAIARPSGLGIMLPSHLLCVLLIGAWFALEDDHRLRPLLDHAIQIVTVGTYFILLRRNLELVDPYEIYTLNGWTVAATLALFSIILDANRTRMRRFLLLYAAAVVLVWHSTALAAAMPVIFAVAAAFALILSRLNRRSRRNEARLHHLTSTLAAEAERARAARELELAREIQDSMLPPADLELGRYRARFLLCRKDAVGGDWYATRTLKDGRAVVLVSDAAGKGIRAAMILHAVQSLWSDALSQDELDVAAWLAGVDACLTRLGAQELQAATIGVLVLAPESITYWSAGHLPLFLVRSGDTGRSVRAVAARGPMLGVGAAARFTPRQIPLAPDEDVELLLCTDGVLPRGMGHSQSEITRLLDAVAAAGPAALEALPVDDDKALVHLVRRARAPALTAS